MMKQHITTKQLGELNEGGEKKLRDWAKFRNLITIPKNNYLPQLSIGQMIEFLLDSDFDEDLTLASQLIRNYTWFDPGVEKNVFCDQLWAAVKGVLNDSK